MAQLQGRRLVILSTGNSTQYYLCHSTEQANYRKILLAYEYREEIVNPHWRQAFLQHYRSLQYAEGLKVFDLHAAPTQVEIVEFTGDEALVNHMNEFAAIQNDLPSQLEAVAEELATNFNTAGDDFDFTPESPAVLEDNDCEETGGPPI